MINNALPVDGTAELQIYPHLDLLLKVSGGGNNTVQSA
jgi:hypothetical protein